jgi:hypothetical protein
MADMQATLDIGGAVSASTSVIQMVQQLLTGARSVTIEVDNNSELTLVRYGFNHGNLRHGGWGTPPRDKIEAGKSDVFSAQNVGGSIATGTEGYVFYHALPNLRLTIWWNNPYIGDNDGYIWVHGPKYKARYSVGAGNTAAQFRFQVFSANQVGGPQVLDVT